MRNLTAVAIIAIGLCLAATGVNASEEECDYLQKAIFAGLEEFRSHEQSAFGWAEQASQEPAGNRDYAVEKAREFEEMSRHILSETKMLTDIYAVVCEP
tara:strand:- start:962 stop:1258 length:297 start_codon:yes stop_codon:yes gene_type:complete